MLLESNVLFVYVVLFNEPLNWYISCSLVTGKERRRKREELKRGSDTFD